MNAGNVIEGFPKDFWEAMAMIGKHDWLDYREASPRPNDPPGSVRTAFTIIENHFDECPQILQVLKGNPGGLFVCWVHAMSKLAAKGVKLFRPTDEQCETMENVDIRIPIGEYRQPYPTMVIEFPEKYRQAITKEFDLSSRGALCPRYLIAHSFPATPQRPAAFFSGCNFKFHKDVPIDDPFRSMAEITYFFADRPEFPTIEHALRKHVSQTAKDSIITERMARIAMNLCLLLGEYNFRLNPSNPKAYTKALAGQKMAGAIGETNRLEASSHVHIVSLEREIVVRRTIHEPAKPGEPTGREMPPHWRRGHWRMQRFGKGRAEKKLIHIPAVFIRRDRFEGNLGDTGTTYFKK